MTVIENITADESHVAKPKVKGQKGHSAYHLAVANLKCNTTG